MIVASKTNQIVLVYLSMNRQIDLGAKLKIGNAKAISSYHGYFYILFNKEGNKLGYFLLQVSEKKPLKDNKFLIKWAHKLDIADAGIHMLQGEEGQDGR